MNGRYVPGVVALIAGVLRRHLEGLGLAPPRPGAMDVGASAQRLGEPCPACHQPTLFRQEGCKKCGSCGYSTCG
ncbi:hypothetical protein CCP2SC5_530015 [Azospirillaceae bacterium]